MREFHFDAACPVGGWVTEPRLVRRDGGQAIGVPPCDRLSIAAEFSRYFLPIGLPRSGGAHWLIHRHLQGAGVATL